MSFHEFWTKVVNGEMSDKVTVLTVVVSIIGLVVKHYPAWYSYSRLRASRRLAAFAKELDDLNNRLIEARARGCQSSIYWLTRAKEDLENSKRKTSALRRVREFLGNMLPEPDPIERQLFVRAQKIYEHDRNTDSHATRQAFVRMLSKAELLIDELLGTIDLVGVAYLSPRQASAIGGLLWLVPLLFVWVLSGTDLRATWATPASFALFFAAAGSWGVDPFDKGGLLGVVGGVLRVISVVFYMLSLGVVLYIGMLLLSFFV